MSTKLEAIVIDGQTVWVEVEDLRPVPAAPAQPQPRFKATANDGPEEAATALEKVDLTRTLTAVVAPVHRTLAQFAPEEVSVEVSLGIKGEVGFFVAKSEGNAALKITAKWKFSQPPASTGTKG